MERHQAIERWAKEVFTACSELVQELISSHSDTKSILERAEKYIEAGSIYNTYTIDILLNPTKLTSLKLDAYTYREMKYQAIKNSLEKLVKLFADKKHLNMELEINAFIYTQYTKPSRIELHIFPFEMQKSSILISLFAEDIMVEPEEIPSFNYQTFVKSMDRAIEYIREKIRWLREYIPEGRWQEWHLSQNQIAEKYATVRKINIEQKN